MKKISKITWLICSFNFLIRRSERLNGDFNRVVGYKLVKNIENKGTNNYFKGIYIKNGKKYFIKIWSSKVKDYFYCSIINEFNITSILFNSSIKTRKYKDLNFVKPIELIENKNQVFAVYEYVDGRSLDKFSYKKQADVISKISNIFPAYTELLNGEELAFFSKRSLLWYVFLVPLRLVLIKAPLYLKIKMIFVLFSSFISGKKINSELEISHRDLTPENVIIDRDGKVYLLDLEQVCLSFRGFDSQSILVAPQNRFLLEYLGVKRPVLNNFLTNIIAIHAMSGEFITEYVEYYSKFINIL